MLIISSGKAPVGVGGKVPAGEKFVRRLIAVGETSIELGDGKEGEINAF